MGKGETGRRNWKEGNVWVLSPELTVKEGEAAEEGQPGPPWKRALGETCKKQPLTSCLSTGSARLQVLPAAGATSDISSKSAPPPAAGQPASRPSAHAS